MTIFKRLNHFLGVATLIVMTGAGINPASADVDVAQTPLIVTSGVEPNISFILDDSGSMRFESMPDELTNLFNAGCCGDYVMWMFPYVSNVHGSGTYGSRRVPSFDEDDIGGAVFRSSYTNSLYYDPSITYRPWSKADGSLMPDADPENAYHNPSKTNVGDRNLTQNNYEYADWVEEFNNSNWNPDWEIDDESRSYYPATYFTYTGPEVDDVVAAIEDENSAIWDIDNYSRVEIKSGNAPFTGEGRENRSDCTGGSCTYAQEMQNFANWYSYHRSRVFASRAGIGSAFSAQSENMRVAYGTINKGHSTIDGEWTRTLLYGVRPFRGNDRDKFFEELYERDIDAVGTPLRQGLEGVGEYYERTDSRGPWSTTPGQSGGDDLECRQNFSILMSDGYWSGNSPGVGDTDGSGTTSHTGPDNDDGGYTPGPPFEDDHSNTLADVAMEYWKNDLRTDLTNRVPVTPQNPAFWQHMVTFTVGLGVQGNEDPDEAFEKIETGESIDWPDPIPDSAEDSTKIDDMLHAAINSRGGFFSASDPETFADELSDVLVNISDRVSSAASVAANSTRLDTDTRIYLARFNSENWSGELLSFSLNEDGSVGDQVWNAANNIPGPGSRDIVTYDPDAEEGVDFEWDQISAGQQALLNQDKGGTVDDLGEKRLNYIRGDQSKEDGSEDRFRTRFSLLGDIVNSAPAFMGAQNFGFINLPDEDEAGSYANFLEEKADRDEIIFVGANDGMLHAFDANTGAERFAFVPNAVYENLNQLTDPEYSHRFYVDGSPRVVDAYVGGEWRTILIGSTGAGGRSVFALDVTNPDTFGPSDVLWEFTHDELGHSIGQPSIIRLSSGEWVAIFGNGYNGASDQAQLFVVDLETGELLYRFNTGRGDAANPNGLATPFPVDLGGNRVTDLIYAGDLQGNMWRFDPTVTGGNSPGFPADFRSGNNPTPLFSAEASDDEPQPITVRPVVGRHPEGGQMVYFGTGKFFETGDNQIPQDPQIQTFYGVRDNGAPAGDRSELVEQTIVVEGEAGEQDANFDFRIISDNDVDYATKDGWYLDLESPNNGAEGERVINDAILRAGRIIFTTSIPKSEPCGFGGTSWLMELDAVRGTRLQYAVFDVDGDGEITEADIAAINQQGGEGHVGGRRIDDMVTVPHILDTGGDTEQKYMGGTSGTITTVEEAASSGDLGRQSWEQLR